MWKLLSRKHAPELNHVFWIRRGWNFHEFASQDRTALDINDFLMQVWFQSADLVTGKTNGFVNRMTSCSVSNSPNLARKAPRRLCTMSLYCTRLITHSAERDWRVGKFVNVPASSCPTNNCNFILKAEISSHKLVNSFSFPCRLMFSVFRWEVMSTKNARSFSHASQTMHSCPVGRSSISDKNK